MDTGKLEMGLPLGERRIESPVRSGRALTNAAPNIAICTIRSQGRVPSEVINAQLKGDAQQRPQPQAPRFAPRYAPVKDRQREDHKAKGGFDVGHPWAAFGSRRLPNTVTRISGSPIPSA